jgi:hypothetical protein
VLCACNVARGLLSGHGGGDKRRVLFVGNSLTFTNDLPGQVHALDPHVEVDSVTVGGASLEDH